MPEKEPTHEEIAELAYQYWEERGEDEGSAEEDWLKAERDLNDSDPLR
jgi:hypothetical protein